MSDFININRKLQQPDFVIIDPNIEDTTSESNTAKKRYNSNVKVAICSTNSNINKKNLYKHEITLAMILTQKTEHNSESFR